MQIRRLGLIVGLALVVGSLISMFLPESETKVEERLFNEVRYQMGEMQVITDELIAIRNGLSGMARVTIDADLEAAAQFVLNFRPSGETHEARKAHLLEKRTQITALVLRLQATRSALIRSNLSETE